MALYRRIDQLPAATVAPAATDIIEGLRNPGAGNALSEKWTLSQLANSPTIEEKIRDVINAALAAGAAGNSGITVTTNDALDSITFTVTGAGGSSFTQAQVEEFARDAVAAMFGAGTHTGVTFAHDDAANSFSATVTGGTGGGFTQAQVEEFARDAVAAMFTTATHTGISFSHNDAGNQLSATVTGGGGGASNLDSNFPVTREYIITDEETFILGSTTTPKLRIRIPFAFTLSEIRMHATIGDPVVTIGDVHGGDNVSLLSTRVTMDANERTSETAATPSVLSRTALNDDEELFFYIDQCGSALRGVKFTLIGARVVA